MAMKNHPHPGRIVRQDFLEPLGLTVTEAARVLGVARQTINNLVNEKAGISAEWPCACQRRSDLEPRCGFASRPITTYPSCGKSRLESRATSGPHRSHSARRPAS